MIRFLELLYDCNKYFFSSFSWQWLCWHGMTHVLLAGTADGQTWVWKVPAGDCKTLLGHGCACNSGKILPDGHLKYVCIGRPSNRKRSILFNKVKLVQLVRLQSKCVAHIEPS